MTQYSGSDALFWRPWRPYIQSKHPHISRKRRVRQELGAGGRWRLWEALPAARRRGHVIIWLICCTLEVTPSWSSPVVPDKLGSIQLFPARIGRVRMGSRILDPVPPHLGELRGARPLCQIPSGFGHFMSRGAGLPLPLLSPGPGAPWCPRERPKLSIPRTSGGPCPTWGRLEKLEAGATSRC